MEDIVYGSFKHDNPKTTIVHIKDALYPLRLRDLVEKDPEYRPKLKKDVQAFIRFVEEQAEHVDKVRSWTTTKSDGKSKAKDSTDRKKVCLMQVQVQMQVFKREMAKITTKHTRNHHCFYILNAMRTISTIFAGLYRVY